VFKRLRTILGLEIRADTGTLADPWTALLLGGAGPTDAGISVTPEAALRFAPVLATVKVLAETTAQLVPHLYRRMPDGGRERVSDHPVEALIADAANDWTSAAEFRQTLATALAIHGNAYAFINRAGDTPTELIPLPWGAVTVERDPATTEPRYRIDGTLYPRHDIFHVRTFGRSPYLGDSPVALAREAIGLGLVLERHAAGLFGRGARPAGVLRYPRQLTEPMAARLRASWDSRYQGGENAGRTAVLEDGLEWQATQLSSVDAQFLELRRFQVQEIARVWRVPLHLIGDLERVTFSNAEQMGAQFLAYTIMPLLRLWQDAFRLSLLTPAERRDGFYIEFMIDDLSRADLAARFTAYSQAINAGILNPNEIRAMENRGPYAGGETYMRPVNTAPAPAGGGDAS
jgi:HK97 family phage portal protein